MTNKDLERLIKVLDGTQFEIENRADGYVWVSLKDLWEGVEFVECITDQSNNFRKGKVYRLVPSKNIKGPNCIYTEDKKCAIYGTASTLGLGGTKLCFNPSTEEAYVNQLKAKAFELYGDIQDLDRFEEPTSYIDTHRAVDNLVNPEWDYIKNQDELFFYSILLYKEGKWATKLPKRIDIKYDGGNASDKNFYFEYDNAATEKMINIGCPKIGEFLAKQLEKYLNDEVD
jgi:hypothetical protein